MLEQQLSSNANRMVRPSHRQIAGIARGFDLADDRGGGRRVGAMPPATPGYTAPPVVPSGVMDGPASGWWWRAMALFMDGVALYGASLYPNVILSVDDEASAPADARQSRCAGSHEPAVTHEQGASQSLNSSSVIAPGLVAWTEHPGGRSDWLDGLGDKVVAMWTHWRKEREIRRAVKALAEYDDRTLLDLGIHGRAEIERMVRYCRDC